jgi:glucose dehydrogenase
MKLRIWLLAILVSGSVLVAQQGTSRQVEWLVYRGDTASSNSSPLTDITADNIQRLRPVWRWEHGENQLDEYKTVPASFETQPMMVDGVLYVSTPYNNAAALDAETGKELWRFDSEAYKLGTIPASGFKHRGVALWRDANDGNKLRILLNARSKLFSLDSKTGRPVTSFGTNGSVSLVDGFPRPISDIRHVNQGSPPVVYKNLVIVGSSIPDRIQRPNEPPGIVQAFDARTGKRVWVFNIIPQSSTDFGANTWDEESWRFTGHGNVWGPMTLDEGRGLLYLPTSTPGSDYYGARRPGANLLAESLVCLDAATGQRKWHFQAVHHGLWDYDFTSPPNLMTITVNGRRIDAVAEVSKQGFTYVFDRVTGQPVWPIEERPVDTTTDVPGEKPWPTQPFPTQPPAFTPQGVSLDDANDLTPQIKALAQAEMKKYRLGQLFTPPSLRGTLQRPTNAGGANWAGAAFDAQTGYLFVRATNGIYISAVAPNDHSDPNIESAYSDWLVPPRSSGPLGGLPMIKPPYGILTAINLNKGEIAWQVPLGEGSASLRNHPLLKGVTLPARLGSGGTGGALVIGSGLIFVGGGDRYLYAFDKNTGREVWRGAIPFAAAALPMTYRTRAGRQFVVVATGAGPDAALIAFALEAQ